jgi:mRNA interferase RelE/StbE
MAAIRFTIEALEDVLALDGSVQPRVLKKILLLEKDPEAGQPLGSRGGTQLATFRKLVVGNRDWRIVYRVEPSGDVVVIWVVGNREEGEVYEEAARRLLLMPSPETLDLGAVVSRFMRRTREVLDPPD